jgi:hypothetical protein
MQSIFHIVVIFGLGGVAFLNLSHMKYGIPMHYESSWLNVVICVSLAVLNGMPLIKRKRG